MALFSRGLRSKVKPENERRMKQELGTLALIAALGSLSLTSQAQIVVWSQNFDSLSLGAYGAHTTDFVGDATNPALPANNIVAPGAGGSGQSMALTFNAVNGTTLNLQTATLEYGAAGNTSANLADYTLSFDMAVQGVNLAFGFGGVEIGIFGPGSWIFNGDALRLSFLTGPPAAGTGYQHFSLPFSGFVPSGNTALNPTDASFSVGFGVINYGNPMTASPETILVDNLQITMVPEPSALTMLASGLGLMVGWRRFRPVS